MPNQMKMKDGNAAALPPKPYSEYTIFFRLERAYLVQSSGRIDEEIISHLDPNHQDALEFPRPLKYQHLVMPPYWYSSSHKAVIEKKRKHRKREGTLDFETLSKTISKKWHNADYEVVEYCRKLARAELKIYNEIVEKLKNVNEVVEMRLANRGGGDVAKIGTTSQVATQPLAFIPNEAMLKNHFSTTMRCGQVGQDEAFKFKQLLQLQQPQMADQNNPLACSDISPTCVKMTATTQLLPLQENPTKRKFVSRASVPPELEMGHMNMNVISNNVDSLTAMGNTISNMTSSMGNPYNVNLFEGEGDGNPHTKQFRRQAYMTSMDAVPNQDQLQVLKESFPMANNGNNTMEPAIFRGDQGPTTSASQQDSNNHQCHSPGKMMCHPQYDTSDDEDELGALIYKSSATAKARAKAELKSEMESRTNSKNAHDTIDDNFNDGEPELSHQIQRQMKRKNPPNMEDVSQVGSPKQMSPVCPSINHFDRMKCGYISAAADASNEAEQEQSTMSNATSLTAVAVEATTQSVPHTKKRKGTSILLWKCEVCKTAAFENYTERVAHEKVCIDKEIAKMREVNYRLAKNIQQGPRQQIMLGQLPPFQGGYSNNNVFPTHLAYNFSHMDKMRSSAFLSSQSVDARHFQTRYQPSGTPEDKIFDRKDCEYTLGSGKKESYGCAKTEL